MEARSSRRSPLREADEEARLAIPFPCACGAGLGRSWEYWGHLGAILGHPGGSWGALGRSWSRLGASREVLGTSWGGSWGGLRRSWGDLGATFRAVEFPIDFLIDFGCRRGAPREAFGESKWSPNRSQTEVEIQERKSYLSRATWVDVASFWGVARGAFLLIFYCFL